MSHLRCEYFLTDYLYKYGNFNASTIKSAYNIEGYFDNYNLDTHILTHGIVEQPCAINEELFKKVQEFIKLSKRFA